MHAPHRFRCPVLIHPVIFPHRRDVRTWMCCVCKGRASNPHPLFYATGGGPYGRHFCTVPDYAATSFATFTKHSTSQNDEDREQGDLLRPSMTGPGQGGPSVSLERIARSVCNTTHCGTNSPNPWRKFLSLALDPLADESGLEPEACGFGGRCSTT